MSWWLADLSARDAWKKIRTRVIPNARYLGRSQFRRCRACDRISLIVAFGADGEFHICLRCRANLRYELIASYLREEISAMSSLDVLELDPGSPLSALLGRARSHTRSFFRENIAPGTRREDGAVCQDITSLTFPDDSLDLIISSDVLEHVPDIEAAFRESARVLRPGGAHIFTVPPRPTTVRRAYVQQGQVIHLTSPEYHSDPLSPSGILAFWDYGPDLASKVDTAGLEVQAVRGPAAADSRVVWRARKPL
jgi:SAM-dependent methyltransferase